VEPAGAAVHLFLSPAGASLASLQESLAREGLGTATFRQIVPSLEDVFIAITRTTERQAGAHPMKPSV
jgi:hypothetical protein